MNTLWTMADRIDTPRIACIDDLKNYFKKKDLLSGLSTLEQEELRDNIGIKDGVSQSEVTDINYATLLSKIANKLLNIGMIYRIIDFQTMYEINHITQSSAIFPVLVIASTSNSLISTAYVEGKNWDVKYSVTQETFTDNTKSKGKITFLRDTNGNSAYYDFKHVQFIRGTQLYYTFSDTFQGTLIDSSELSNTKHNTIEQDCTNNIFIGDTYNNIIQAGSYNNTFYSGCINSCIGYDSVNNIFNEAVRYTSGTIANKTFQVNDTTLATTITKRVQKVNDKMIVSYLDPITYAYQVIEI